MSSESYADKYEPSVGEQSHTMGTAQLGVQPGVQPRGLQEEQTVLLGEKSPGVARIEAINRHLTVADRVALAVGVFLIAYAYGLDGTIRYTYQPMALASFETHSLLSTVGTVRTVIAAAAQPTAAKLADVFGRLELLYASIVFYVVGTIIEAASTNVSGFAAGAVIYQIGYTIVTLLVEVIVADVTSLRSRLLWSYISATPFLINAWVSGDVAAAVLGATTWKWGIGMWALIYPVMAIPLIVALTMAARRARKSGDLVNYKTPYQQYGAKKIAVGLFWQLDVVGILLVILIFGLILVPFSLAGGERTSWGAAHTIAPLVIGFCLVPVFIIWERKALHPLVPFHLLKDRGVWGALGIACTLNFVWYMQGDYLYTVVIVAFDESLKSAQRITSLYSFVSVLTGVGLSIVVRFGVPYLKPFIFFGTAMFMVAFGILIQYRGGTSSSSHAGIVAGQCVLGFGGGLFSYPAQVLIQAATKHEHLALVTGLYLALYNIGSALGLAVSGAIWTQTLPEQLNRNLAAVSNNATLGVTAYGNPFGFIAEYPVGTPERSAVIAAYQHVQRLLCITGICLCVLLCVFAMFLRNPRLGKEQTLPNAEGSDRASETSDYNLKDGEKGEARPTTGGKKTFLQKLF